MHLGFFDRLASKIISGWRNLISRLKAFWKRLLFPLWLFPIKLVTYSLYYLVRFIFKLILAIFGLVGDVIVFPFKSLKNFLKSIVYTVVVVYLFFSVLVIGDYITRQYGDWGKLFCGTGVSTRLKNSIVRIEGQNGEGSGFFINENQVLTNFHVIADEPSPKIVFPDGKIETPNKIVGDVNADLAILTIQNKYPDFVYPLPDNFLLTENEPLISAGYALGSNIKGNVTILRGNFVDYRNSKKNPVGYIQTSISLVPGMSGGPLVDQCGSLRGVNTMGVAGLSLFIGAQEIPALIPSFTDKDIVKIDVDPTLSPESAVTAFYTYLKARRMEDGFNLLSKKYLEKTNFTEWTARFSNILDVGIYKSEKFENSPDTAFVKFYTRTWIDGEVEIHFYEGTWQTVQEDGVYKMLKSKIKEVSDPPWDWYYN